MMTKMNKRLGVLTLGALAVGAGLYAWSGMNTAKATFEPSRLATVEQDTMVRSVVATGKVEPISKVEIKSKANGIIERLHFDVGDVVKAGDVLVELERRTSSRRCGKRARTSRPPTRRCWPRRRNSRRTSSRPRVPTSSLPSARRSEPRIRPARSSWPSRNSTPPKVPMTGDEPPEGRRGQLVVAQANVSEAAAQVAQARANLDTAEEELRNATIRAPIAGMVLTRDIEIGSPVSSILNLGANATLVMTLGDIKEVFVRGKVDEAEIGQVKYEQAARISVETFKDKKFDGRVTLISPMGAEKDNVTTFEVKVSIDNPGNELKANMTANAEIILEERPNSLIIPEAAIAYDAQRQASVDLFDPNEPTGRRKVPVKVGISNGTRAQLLEGVKKGDRVILPS